MMKNDFLKKAVGTLSVAMAIVAIPALVANGTGMIQDPVEDPREPYCLLVTDDPTGSMSGTGYVGEAFYTDSLDVQHSRGVFGLDMEIRADSIEEYDDNGDLINKIYDYEIMWAQLRSVKNPNGGEGVYLPDTIAYVYRDSLLKKTLTDVEFNYYTPEQGNTERNTFVDCEGLKHVYVGPAAQNVTWHGEDFLKLRNFHFRSPEVPNFNFYDGSNGTINLHVPETLFAHYTDVIDGASYTATVWSEAPLSPVYVNVDIPGTLADAVSSNINNLDEVRWLVVTGTPNEQDLRMMRRLPRLEILDLSATTGLETVVGCNGLKYLREVIFPEGITYIAEEAFKDCKGLDEMIIPASVKEIRNSAFQNSSIRKINLENVETIKEYAFRYSKVENLDLSSAKSISYGVFEECTNLESVCLKSIEYIGGEAFYYTNLKSLSIPNSCRRIDGWAPFGYNYNLKEVELGTGLIELSSDVFYQCPIEKVTVRTLFPTSQSGFNNSAFAEGATLYVPALTLNEYLLADGWAMFKNVKPLNEELDDIKIDRTFMLTSDRGIAKGATLSLAQYDNEMDTYGNYGNLTVRRNINAPLKLGKYLQGGQIWLSEYWTNEGYRYDNRYYGSTLIPYSEMTADEVELKMTLQTGRWHFISLPFDVNVKDIKVTDETLWVVRRYSGEDRAALNEKTWVNMVDGDILKAGEGYIFHCANDNKSEVVFTFTPASVESGNKFFAKDAVSYELAEYKSEYEHNASWNLTGNTYPAYLNLRAIDFDGPVTVYNGNTYTAYSPVDDDFVFEPFQAFFVQRQDTENGDKLTINPEGRAHSSEEAATIEVTRKLAPKGALTDGYEAVAPYKPNRSLLNIHITGESGTDRARVVVNEAAAMAYEKNRDASKFMSTEKDVPQIFVMNDNRRMAIDERPLGNGEIALGAYFGKSGEYTISLDTRNAEGYTVTLIDNKTGISTDLTAADYTFEADAATDQTRFTLVLNGETTAADAVEAAGVKVSVEGNVLSITAPEEIEIAVVAADGKTVASGRAARFEAVLETGVYAVKAADVTKKIMVK